MKKSELTQIKGLDLKELNLKVKSIKDEIAKFVMDKSMKKLKDIKMISKKRKDLAKILTIARQKQMLVQLESRVESQESSEGGTKKKRKEKSPRL